MTYGFLDEAGDVGVGARSSRNLIVAVLLASSPLPLRRQVKKFRQGLPKKKNQIPELKASRSPAEWNRRRLKGLATLEVEVVVVRKEKTAATGRRNVEELYHGLCVQAVEECLKQNPSLTLCIDKRYTQSSLRDAQERIIRDAVMRPGRTLTIEHLDSAADSAIQQADVLAWVFFQKYEHGDESFAAVLQERVVVERKL